MRRWSDTFPQASVLKDPPGFVRPPGYDRAGFVLWEGHAYLLADIQEWLMRGECEVVRMYDYVPAPPPPLHDRLGELARDVSAAEFGDGRKFAKAMRSARRRAHEELGDKKSPRRGATPGGGRMV